MISRKTAWLASSLLILAAGGRGAAQVAGDTSTKSTAPFITSEVDAGSPAGPLPGPGPANGTRPLGVWDATGNHGATSSASNGPYCSPQPHGCGCQRGSRRYGSCWGLSEEFIPQPLGGSLYANCNVQVANAIAARLMLYHYDFIEGSDQLNQKGSDRLLRLAGLLCASPAPLVIERTPWAPGLDEARRLTVLNALGHISAAVPVERVVIGAPMARGLDGIEAEIIYQNLLIQTQSGGTREGAGGGSVGGSAGLGPNATGRPGS
jgi:hypothetical protein